MTTGALLAGAIPEKGLNDVLDDLKAMHTTGLLRIEGEDQVGEIALIRGEYSEGDQDKVRLLTGHLQRGRFAVFPRLPPLPVSGGSDVSRRGSLSVHPVDALLQYCEGAALTGRLLLEHEGRVALAKYEAGRVVETTIDQGSPEDFDEALSWESGSFRVDVMLPVDDPSHSDQASGDDFDETTAVILVRELEDGLAQLQAEQARKEETWKQIAAASEVTSGAELHPREKSIEEQPKEFSVEEPARSSDQRVFLLMLFALAAALAFSGWVQ